MPLYVGSTPIERLYVGSTLIGQAYYGSTKVYQYASRSVPNGNVNNESNESPQPGGESR